MNKNILVKNGCKRIPPMHETLQRRKIKSTSQVHDSSTVDGNTSTPVEDELIELVKRMPEAEQKAKSAMHFADGYRVYGARVFKSAWDFGGPHCFLATYTPFAPPVAGTCRQFDHQCSRTHRPHSR